MKTLRVASLMLVAASLYAATAASTFYVYSDKGKRESMSFAPSGWMGDYGDIKINDASTDNCVDGKTCFKITYTGKGTQGANWAGMFWQHPPNNWGTVKGGYDLTKYKRLTFWARGEKGGEVIAEFKVGGITGEYGDSGAQSIGPITLTKEWKKYTIELKDVDLQSISGGFCWSASRDDNPEGLSFVLDEVRYEA